MILFCFWFFGLAQLLLTNQDQDLLKFFFSKKTLSMVEWLENRTYRLYCFVYVCPVLKKFKTLVLCKYVRRDCFIQLSPMEISQIK